MKKGILVLSLSCVIILGGLTWFSQLKNEPKVYYQPRESKSISEEASGSAAYIAKMRVNQITGEIDPQDYNNALAQAQQMRQGKTSTLNLQWEEVGPSDLGGRTRAIIFDNTDPSIMFMASVSGGIFKSTDAGRSWLPVDDLLQNLAVVSLAQAPNGDIYAGTGESMYYFTSGNGSGGISGNGIYKSTDGGATFTQLAATDPSVDSDWRAVGKIEVDPNNSDRVYAATQGGLKYSDDAGVTWNNVSGITTGCSDMVITASGTIWVASVRDVYKVAPDLTVTTISGGTSGLPAPSARMRLAVSPQDENYAYAVNVSGSQFLAAYQTTDGGSTWTQIGAYSALLDPHSDQGNYNNALAVDPKDKERILVGGVVLFEWSKSGGWLQIASNSRLSTVFFVHSDIHEIEFHPTDLNTIYIGTDGGLHKSVDDGFTYSIENKGYATIQFYGIAVSADDRVIGGTQDNSNIMVDPNGPLPTAGAFYLDGSDGGKTAMSRLDPTVWFTERQNGVLNRTSDNGENFTYILEGAYRSDGAAWAAPMALHEEINDTNSTDFIRFAADTLKVTFGYGDGRASAYSDTVLKSQDAVEFESTSFVISAGNQVLTSDASGNLSGDGTGTFDAASGFFSVNFNDPTYLEIKYEVATFYPEGARIVLSSNTNDLPIIIDSLTPALQTGQEIFVQDPYQALFVFGGTVADGSDGNTIGGVWITRDAISRKELIPDWWHIGSLSNGETPHCLAISGDANNIWVGTQSGRVYRLSNIDSARSLTTASIDNYIDNGNLVLAQSVVKESMVYNSGNRNINGIAVDPNNPDRVIITLGNYGNSAYVFYSSNATSSNPTFTDVTGDLPTSPVYDAVFNAKGAANSGQVIIGTDFGVFSTTDIDASSVSWTAENSGFANVPVFDLLQDLTVRTDLAAEDAHDGIIYAGTHGRGIFKTRSLVDYVSVPESQVDNAVSRANRDVLDIYPNPANDLVNIELNLENKEDIRISVRDISGRLVKMLSLNGVPAGTESISVNVNDLKAGNYIISAVYGNSAKTAKLVVKQ